LVVRPAVQLALLFFQGGWYMLELFWANLEEFGERYGRIQVILEGMEVEANEGKAERSRIQD